MQILLTEHAIKRARKRLGWSNHALLRMTDHVFHFGLGSRKTRGAVRRYLCNKERDAGAVIRTYGEHLFVFQQGDSEGSIRLVTVMHVAPDIRPRLVRQFVEARAA